MFREMRRKKQQLSREETAAILKECTSGVLAVSGDGGYPYAVPLSYIYDEKAGKICFHSALSGHKVDALRREEKASFCVIQQDEIVPERFTTCFRSVIAFGRVRVIEEEGERREAIEKLSAKYSPGEDVRKEIDIAPNFLILELTIDHMTGKEAIELVRAREADKTV